MGRDEFLMGIESGEYVSREKCIFKCSFSSPGLCGENVYKIILNSNSSSKEGVSFYLCHHDTVGGDHIVETQRAVSLEYVKHFLEILYVYSKNWLSSYIDFSTGDGVNFSLVCSAIGLRVYMSNAGPVNFKSFLRFLYTVFVRDASFKEMDRYLCTARQNQNGDMICYESLWTDV